MRFDCLTKSLLATLLLCSAGSAQTVEVPVAQITPRGVNNFGTSTGGTDDFVVNPDPALREYADGVRYQFKANVANAGPATLNISGLGAVNITLPNGGALADSAIVADMQVTVRYNTTGPRMELQSIADPGSGGGGGGGWQLDGTTVRLITPTNEVSVGTSGTYGKATLEGDSPAQPTRVIRLAPAQTADAFVVQNSAGTELLSIDKDGLLEEGKAVTTGRAKILGNPGGTDSGASSVTAHSGDTTAKPGYVQVTTADGDDAFFHAGTDDGCGVISSSVPGAEGTDCIVSQRSRIANADSGNDSYTATLVPGSSEYVNNHTYCFSADVPNDGAASINFNTLGALPIKKLSNQDLATGDIIANQKVCGIYDGTNFQMTSQLASSPSASAGGSDTQIQYNSGGSLAGISGLSSDGTDLTLTGIIDGGSGTVEIPNSASLPGTCTVGHTYMDTDATTGRRFFLCESTNNWVLQGDGSGSGTSGDWVTVAGGVVDFRPNPREFIALYEEFMGGTTTNFQIGNLGGWSSNNGTALAKGASVAGHPGIYVKGTTDTINRIGTFQFNNSMTANPPVIDLHAATWRSYWVVRLDQTAETTVRLGFANSSVANPPAGGMYFEGITASAGAQNWNCVTRASSTETSNDSATVMDTAWHTFEMRGASGSITFYIDGSLKCTNSTNLISTAVMPFLHITNTEALDKQIDIDAWAFWMKVAR